METTTNGVELVKEKYEKDVSNSTIRRILHQQGFKNYKKQHKPMISKSNILKRKNFYNFHKNYTYENFKNYIFTDESSFQLLNTKGGKTFYKTEGSKHNANSFIRTKKFLEAL